MLPPSCPDSALTAYHKWAQHSRQTIVGCYNSEYYRMLRFVIDWSLQASRQLLSWAAGFNGASESTHRIPPSAVQVRSHRSIQCTPSGSAAKYT